MQKRISKTVYKGSVPVGGGNPISVQSMTNTDTRDVPATVAQIKRLELAGCEIIRVAVPDEAAAALLAEIKKQISIPLIADIHFDYRLALQAIAQGVDGLRLNPGNIPKKEHVKQVVQAAQERRLPIRIGVNAGSLPKDILEKFGHPTPEAMVESALRHIQILEELDYTQIVVSLKAFDILQTIEANQLFAAKRDYPLHLGITEAGPLSTGTIRSAVGLGGLLLAGLGDTIRVSLTAEPVEEVRVAYEILKCLGLRSHGPIIVSCPTCGRTEIDIISIATEVERRLAAIKAPLKIAVMGCVVNGPGEAREADFGIAGGKGVGLIFSHGEIIKKVPEAELVDNLLEIIKQHLD